MPRNLHPWGQVSLDEARQFHEAYVAAHPKRLDTFLSTLAQAGFDIASVEFTSMVLLDEVWDFAITHLNPAWNIGPDDRPPVEWYPDLDGWESWEARRNQGPKPVYDPPDVEVERFDDDGEMPNWFHATISPDFTASANTALIDRFIAELLAQRAIAEAYRSDTEWVAVKSKRRATEQRIQAIVDKAWQTAKTVHPPVLD